MASVGECVHELEVSCDPGGVVTDGAAAGDVGRALRRLGTGHHVTGSPTPAHVRERPENTSTPERAPVWSLKETVVTAAGRGRQHARPAPEGHGDRTWSAPATLLHDEKTRRADARDNMMTLRARPVRKPVTKATMTHSH